MYYRTHCLRRLTQELKLLDKNPEDEYFCNVVPINGDMYHWTATLKGPSDTPYKGGYFNLQMKFNSSYPFSPIKVKFLTKIYHPNISDSGEICLNILREYWSPAISVEKTLISIVAFLNHPNPDYVFKNRLEIAKLYKNDIKTYIKNARKWTKKYASLRNHNQYIRNLKSKGVHLRRSARIKKK